MEPQIFHVRRRTSGQRGMFNGLAECPLPLWWAEAILEDCEDCGEGDTEEEARQNALRRVQERWERLSR